jgi:gliding motility-associated-like protein
MIDKSICQGETFTFDGNVLNVSGQYFATFPSVDGCDSSVTLNLLVNNNSFTNLIDTICANENYVFGNRTLNTSGIYKDTLPTYLGCDSLVTLNLKVNQVYQKTVKDSFCVNDIYTFDSLSFSLGGSYTINYKSANYCDSIIQLELIQKNYPIIQLASDTFICRGIAVIIQINAEGGTEILWQDGSNADRYEISEAGFYSVTLKNICGETSDTIFVADGCDGCEASIPNAFTPNGDGLNDVFKPLISCEPIEINFTIYNRWGELVYSSKSSTVGWNGTFNGSDAMTDAYVWQLDYSYEFGGTIKTKQDKGVVVLIR